MTAAQSRDLSTALDAIVARFGGPRKVFRELAPVERRLRDTARRRSRALRTAITALQETRDEPFGSVVRTPNGSLHATIGALYRMGCERQGRSGDADLDALLLALREAADMHENAMPVVRRGRPREPFLNLLVREVALACLAHGVRFTDNPHGQAATFLDHVFTRVEWVGAWRSGEGLRRHLRYARLVQDAQQRQRTET